MQVVPQGMRSKENGRFSGRKALEGMIRNAGLYMSNRFSTKDQAYSSGSEGQQVMEGVRYGGHISRLTEGTPLYRYRSDFEFTVPVRHFYVRNSKILSLISHWDPTGFQVGPNEG